MLIIEDVKIAWHNRTKKHYTKLGYQYTKNGDLFTVKSNQLTKGSHVKVSVLCDYCKNEVVKKQYKTYLAQNEKSIIKKDCCLQCRDLKRVESNILTYGVENVMYVEEHKKAQEKSLFASYGVTNPSQSPEIRARKVETSQKNYGVDYYFQRPEFQDELRVRNLEVWGVEWYTQTQEYKNRVREFSLENYGVEHFGQSEEHLQNIIEGVQKKHGVDNNFQTEETKNKIKQGNMEKYGVPYYQQTEQFSIDTAITWSKKSEDEISVIIAKRERTSMENYGFRHPQQSPTVREKTMDTMYKNGTAPSSKQQDYIHQLVKGELNYPVGRSYLDIAFPECKIYLEYDGGGHDLQVKFGNITQKQFENQERKRSYYLRNQGWREMRIITSIDVLPKDSVIVSYVDKAKSFLLSNKIFSVRYNIESGTVLINYKKEVTLSNFLSFQFNENSLDEVV